MNRVQKEYGQASRRLRLPFRHQQCPILYAASAARAAKPVNVVAAFVAVLGLRIVEMSATQNSTIHGRRVFKLAKVSHGETERFHMASSLKFLSYYR